MASNRREQLPMKMTYFFLSCVGFGAAETKNDRKLLNISLCIFIVMSMAAIYVTITGFYLTLQRGIISEAIAAAFLIVTTFLTSFKLIVCTLQRTPYERLLRLTDETLWIQSWTEYGKIVLKQCERRAQIFLFIFVILGHASGAGWIIEPIFLNMKYNSSNPHNRRLPFEVILGIPIYESPYYEICYVIDVFGIYIVTILYFCFDYYLVLVNIFVVGQFEILRQRFEEIYTMRKTKSVIDRYHDNEKKYQREYITMDYISREFKNCVKQHQFLISLVNDIESIYNIMNLVQVLMLSLIICLVGFELLMPVNLMTRIKNGVFIGSCLIQLFTFTLSCHNLMIASSDIGNGIYYSRWYHENHTEEGRSLSKNFMIVLMKAKYPCYLTGWKFFPITLDTLKSILTTAFSYLTLMRQTMEE